MVWQPAPLQPQPQQEGIEAKVIPFEESPTLKRLRGIKRINIYAFWFLTGVAVANLSRFIPNGWILYWVLIASVASYLLFVPSEESTEAIATRRLAGMALALSCVSYWDAIIAIITLPIHVFNWIMPVWMVVPLAVGLVCLLVIISSML